MASFTAAFHDQAIRMLMEWAAEIDALSIGSEHPMQTARHFPPSKRRQRASKAVTATGVESRKTLRSRVPIRELTATARRTDKILEFIRVEDTRAFKALDLFARATPHVEAARRLKMGEHDHRASLRVGLTLMAAILRLRAL
jgi:hypothetical protein